MKKKILSAALCCILMAGSFASAPALSKVSDSFDTGLTVSAASSGTYRVRWNFIAYGYYKNGRQGFLFYQNCDFEVTNGYATVRFDDGTYTSVYVQDHINNGDMRLKKWYNF